nr:unnamed protein product [Callosobruchus analis]
MWRWLNSNKELESSVTHVLPPAVSNQEVEEIRTTLKRSLATRYHGVCLPENNEQQAIMMDNISNRIMN